MSDMISTQYNAIANVFSEQAKTLSHSNRTAFYSILDFDFTKKRLLDVGCADGYDLEEYQKRGASVYGLDAAKEMIGKAKQRIPTANLSIGNMENLPYGDNYFDIVVSKYALQISKDLSKVIAEITRVLKPGGIFAYLSDHPFRQFLEKKKNGKDYFLQELVETTFFNGEVTVIEPSHTMNEYLSPYFLAHYRLLHFEEQADCTTEKINGDTYPGFFMVKAQKLSQVLPGYE